MALTSIMCCSPLLNIEPKFLVLISKAHFAGFFLSSAEGNIMDFKSYSISKAYPLPFLDMLID